MDRQSSWSSSTTRLGHREISPRNRAEGTGRLDHRLAEVLWRGDAAEAQVDGWFAGIKECLRFSRTVDALGGIQAPVLNDTLVCQIRPGRHRRVGRQPRPVGEQVTSQVGDLGQPR